jgi:hypothetical protein
MIDIKIIEKPVEIRNEIKRGLNLSPKLLIHNFLLSLRLVYGIEKGKLKELRKCIKCHTSLENPKDLNHRKRTPI